MTNVKAQSSNECQNLNVKWMIWNLTFEIHLAFGIWHYQVVSFLGKSMDENIKHNS